MSETFDKWYKAQCYKHHRDVRREVWDYQQTKIKQKDAVIAEAYSILKFMLHQFHQDMPMIIYEDLCGWLERKRIADIQEGGV